MRYLDRQILMNDHENYEELLRSRNRNYIAHYDTPRLKYPTLEEFTRIETKPYVWKVGSSLSKISYEEYGTTKYWYVIGFLNKAPTDAHLIIGDKILVPINIEEVLTILEQA